MPKNWLHHKPEQVVRVNGTNILWDMPVTTDKKVKCNRPDIIVHDTNTRKCILIDIAVPSCTNVVTKTADKLCKYKELEIEIQKLWNLVEVRTIPIIIGALGTALNGLCKYSNLISENIDTRTIQKTALLGSAHILRNVLSIKET